MSKKHKKLCRVLNYIQHLLTLISDLASLVGIPIVITSSSIGLKICVITAGIKKYKSIVKKNKKNRDKILSLAKSKLNSGEVLISKALVDSNIRQDELV